MAKFWENHPEIRERAAAKRAGLEKKRHERVAERAKRIAEREEKRKALAAEKAKKSAEREKARLAKAAARAKRIAEREKTRKEKVAEREKHRTAHPKPPAAPQSRRPRKRRKWKRKFLTKKEWREFNDKIHCKPVIATPKKGGKTLRFGSARNAARTLLARGVTKNALGAQQKISLVCNGYRQSAFGYFWRFESYS